jgi:RES domain-containing protein
MIQAWRIAHQDYADIAFDGEGARITGGRWNSEGVPVVYTAGTLSLALLEIIVHLEIKEALKYFKAIPIKFSDSLVESVPLDALPLTWNNTPPPFMTKIIGDEWVRQSTSVILRVPSAVVPNELNFLLNPNHPDFKKIEIGDVIDLPADPRILGKLK